MIEVTNSLLFFCCGDTCAEFHQPIIAIHLDVAVMGINDCLGNGKAKSIVLILAIPGGIHAVESLKDPLPVFCGDKHYGLGLAIAKAIVDAHHGHIEVRCYNGLVEFRVSLPIPKEK